MLLVFSDGLKVAKKKKRKKRNRWYMYALLMGRINYFYVKTKRCKSCHFLMPLGWLVWWPSQVWRQTPAPEWWRIILRDRPKMPVVSASGQWSCCLGAGSVFVQFWLSRLSDNSADNSWDRRLSLSHREIWFPPSAWSHGLPRAFLLPPQEHSLGQGSRSHGNSLWG